MDEKNCFGSLEWPAVRQATKQGLPRHHAVTCWKHRVSSSVEQDGVQPLPKDRGAEQGDVGGPLECSLALGIVGSEARSTLHRSQRSGNLPWSSHPSEQVADMEAAFDSRTARSVSWHNSEPTSRRLQSGSRAILTDPAHELQFRRGIKDFWYLDDGDILCDPRLVLPYLNAFDEENEQAGA